VKATSSSSDIALMGVKATPSRACHTARRLRMKPMSMPRVRIARPSGPGRSMRAWHQAGGRPTTAPFSATNGVSVSSIAWRSGMISLRVLLVTGITGTPSRRRRASQGRAGDQS